MEALAPPLEFIVQVRFGLESGHSVRKSCFLAIERTTNKKWRKTLELWTNLIELGLPTEPAKKGISLFRKQCLDLMEQGFKGRSIYEPLCLLEKELIESADAEMEQYVATLPIKSLIPLLFFQFPAFLALLLGPFLMEFLNQS